MHRTHALIASAAAVLVLAGCGSLGGTTAAGGAPSSAPSSAPAASSAPCTTKACIVSEAEQSLQGGIAEDKAVALSATCRRSTVRHHAGDIWTVDCVVHYSDGSESAGVATLLMDQGKITFEPTG